jgi:tyrosinase
MSSIQALHDRAEAFLKRPPNNLPVNVPATEELEALGAAMKEEFSVFLPDHLNHALALASKFVQLANANPGEAGLNDVLDEAERAAQVEDIELVKYALMVFITHHQEGRRLPIPSLEERSPEKIVPSQKEVALGLEPQGGLGVEAQLDYFREDTWVNEHHAKWHVVYPGGGHPDPTDPTGQRMLTKNRQGELFWYMHQQMLARYDAERKAFNLAATVALSNYRTPISEGYEANLPGFSNRKPNQKMRDIPGMYSVADHEQRRDRLFKAAQDGELRKGAGTVKIQTPSLLADTTEANVSSVEGPNWGDPQSFYGQFHNFGHVLISRLPDPTGPFPTSGGVMGSTATAVRDPVFFRWHRHVDEVIFEWQEKLGANDFKTNAPQVLIRKTLDGGAPAADQSPDILLCLQRDIQGATKPDFDGQKFGEQTFGGANWNQPLSSFPSLTNELLTTIRFQDITLPDGTQGVKPYLDHEEFYYFLRLENLLDSPQKVTVRIFLVAREYADNRRMWIEMDKFAQPLDPKQKSVVFRPARLSSVARKPATRPTEPRPKPAPGTPADNYCDCGWPYHLLLPRGNEQGMDFRLLVMLTDWQADLVGAEKKCGSMSFCGAKDADYPDQKPMGYPFDRPFKNLSIAQTVAAQQNMATRDFKIRFVP